MIAKRSFFLLDSGTVGLGVYADNDRDGFDDVTGLPTHAWACYSGGLTKTHSRTTATLGDPMSSMPTLICTIRKSLNSYP